MFDLIVLDYAFPKEVSKLHNLQVKMCDNFCEFVASMSLPAPSVY